MNYERRVLPELAGPGARCRWPALAARELLNEWGEQRKFVGKIRKHRLEVTFHGSSGPPPRTLGGLTRVAPKGELMRDSLLNRLPIGEVDCAARPRTDEVRLAQREALGERRHLDQSCHPIARRRREREPVPAPADHLPEGADGDAAQLLGQRLRCAHQVAHAGRLPLAPDADGERRDLTPAGALGLECAAVQDKGDAAWIVLA